MSADDPEDDFDETGDVRDRLEQEADRAIEGFDEGVVDLLAWVLDTETRARIYVTLRQNPESTSDEIADATGLYPSTVREALAELHDEDTVERDKREASGAGNNPYEYEAIAPSELVQGVVGDVQRELNAVFNLDRRLGGESPDGDAEPVQISVGDDEGEADTGADEADADAVEGREGAGDAADAADDDGDRYRRRPTAKAASDTDDVR
jgi:predicted transcriptional regulator